MTEAVLIFVTCISYVSVLDDASQEKSTVLFKLDILVPVSQTLPLAGDFNVTLPGAFDWGVSELSITSSPESEPLQEVIKIVKNKKVNFFIF